MTDDYCDGSILPPLFTLLSVISALLLVALLFYGALRSDGYIALTAKTCAFLIILAILPTLVSAGVKRWGQLVVVIAQALLATFTVVGYMIWMIGSSILGVRIGLLFALLLVLLVGAYVLELQRKRVLHRLTVSEKYPLAADEAKRLENTLKRGILLYLSIPLGALISVGYGWVTGTDEVVAVILMAPTILIAASLILFVMLITSAVAMSNSLLLLETDSIEACVVSKPAPSFFERFLTRFLRLRLPEVPEQEEPDYTQGLDMACAVSDLRKLYFYDSVHNCALVISFSTATVSLISPANALSIIKWFVGILFLVLFLFCYLPFSIGQFHLHEEILDAYRVHGLARSNLKKDLKGAGPLYPGSDFGGALVASGTAGGLILTLIIEVLKNALK